MTPLARPARRLRDVTSVATGLARTALVVPVPWAERLIGEWRERYDASAAAGMPAHVTILYPFLPARKVGRSVDAALEETVGRVRQFRFRLTRLGAFPSVAYLRPEPAEPFVELTEAVWRRWPDCPPYAGAHEEIVPHLTIATGPAPPRLDEIERGLPLEGPADEVWLMAKDVRGRWTRRRSFDLAGPT